MFIRNCLAAAILAAGAVSPSLAAADTGVHWVGGEIGWDSHIIQGQLSRAQVLRELDAFRKDPTTADGYEFVGGEIGYVPRRTARAERSSTSVLGNIGSPVMPAPAGATIDPYTNGGPN